MSISKALQLLSILVSDPGEFLERSRMIAGRTLSLRNPREQRYEIADWKLVVEQLSAFSGCRFKAALEEAELADLALRLRHRMKSLPSEVPFGTFHNGDMVLAELCYGIVRSMRPKNVVETGVCYGVTSAFLLTGLDKNEQGHLYSIDLPPLGRSANDYVGWLVPEELRRRWTLRRGTSRKLLDPMLKELSNIDLFIHDSLHTYKNMKLEFDRVWPYLSLGGVLIADDIEGNAAFEELSGRGDVAFHAVVEERGKDSLAGILIKSA